MTRDGEVKQRQHFYHHGDTICHPRPGYVTGYVSEKGDHMGWPDSETNHKFVVHLCEEIPIIS